ncbi:hypothetical protein [Mastigocoleus testarum]|uniref:Uncharacterized protein n=1 Tax=Mastigocoleus testarum BC008 TaxID=371196 RepID=A0A0V7ZKR4_9CYAN|nr:hypothetical protein [Mastigocoleus testarum]KST65242.1 hypothetical protein BC008_20845 [Mastigocoleus testarum BC008]
MFHLAESNNIIVFAITGGCFCAILSSVIDDVFEIFIVKNRTINIRKILSKYTISIFTLGLFLGLIFYAFALKENKPIQMIILFTVSFGLVAPILSKLIVLFYTQLFSKKQNS